MSEYLQRDQKRLDGSHPFTKFPVHLYHATEKPVIANTHAEEQAALAKGYSTEYIPQHPEPKESA